jgi:hypothetical protein
LEISLLKEVDREVEMVGKTVIYDAKERKFKEVKEKKEKRKDCVPEKIQLVTELKGNELTEEKLRSIGYLKIWKLIIQ